jgi:acyl carrier protein
MDISTKAKVSEILTKITGRKFENIDLESDLKSQLELDSIQIVEFFASLENEFNIELPLSMLTVKTGSAFMKILNDQLTNRK